MYQKAMMLGMTKQYGQQVAALDALIKAYPKSELIPQAMFEKANALATDGKGREAVDAYNALLKAYPNSVEARRGLLQMAVVDKNMNNEDAAIEAYKRSSRAIPAARRHRPRPRTSNSSMPTVGSWPTSRSSWAAYPLGHAST